MFVCWLYLCPNSREPLERPAMRLQWFTVSCITLLIAGTLMMMMEMLRNAARWTQWNSAYDVMLENGNFDQKFAATSC